MRRRRGILYTAAERGQRDGTMAMTEPTTTSEARAADALPEARRRWMGVLALSSEAALAGALEALGPLPPHDEPRPPETGSVMVRGRMGGNGAGFSLGEVTVTRCTVRLAGGAVGHAHVQGRGRAHARRAALVDAMMQTEAAGRVRAAVLEPLERAVAERRALRAARAEATRVEFLTLARGE